MQFSGRDIKIFYDILCFFCLMGIRIILQGYGLFSILVYYNILGIKNVYDVMIFKKFGYWVWDGLRGKGYYLNMF